MPATTTTTPTTPSAAAAGNHHHTFRGNSRLEYTVSPLQQLGPTVASHSLMVGACVCALFSDMNTESAILSTGLPLLALAAICGYQQTTITTARTTRTTTTDNSGDDNTLAHKKIGRILYLFFVFLLPVALCRALAAQDYFSTVKHSYWITLAFVLPMMLLMLMAMFIQKRLWLLLQQQRIITSSTNNPTTANIQQLLSPLASPTLLCGIFQLLFRFSPIGATGNPVMGLAVIASPPLKLAVVSVVGEIGLLFGLGLISSLGAGQLVGQTQKRHWIFLALVWAVLQIGGGWRLASGMGLWQIPIPDWPLSQAPDLHISCLCAGSRNDTLLLDRINMQLSAGDDLIILSEAAMSQRIHPDMLHWSAENPGAVVAVAFSEPVQAAVPNSTSDKLYNSIELLQAGQSLLRYDKNRPVPIMEAPWVQAGKDPPRPTDIVFTPFMRSDGTASATWQRNNVTLRVAAAICFDFDFPDVLRHARGADLVIGPSNYWSSLGRNLWSDNMYRAMEWGFTLVKCASAGISGGVDPLGRTLTAKPTLARDTFLAQIPIQPGVSTIYANHGGYCFGWSCVVLSVVLIIVAYWPHQIEDGAAVVSSSRSNMNGDVETVLTGGSGSLEEPLLPSEEQNSLEEPMLSIEEQDEAQEDASNQPNNDIEQHESSHR